MSINGVSTASIASILTSQLQGEQSNLATLNEQLASSQKYSDLTDYAPGDALNLLNLQNSSTQRNAYLGVISTVQARMSGYDTTMTDMESIVSQAQTLAAGSQAYSTSNASSLAIEAQNFLKSISVDLNTQIDGRYIYAGSRFNTQPVTDLTTLTNTPSDTVYTDGSTLPVYDSGYSAGALTMSTSGQTLTISGTPADNQSASVTVDGKTYTYATTAADTSDTVASGLSALLTAAGISSTVGTSPSTLTLTGGSDTLDAASSNNTSAAAYTQETATIDSSYTIQYGVTSNNPAFQKLISGLQYLAAAGNSTDSATYSANVSKATSTLSSALTALQGVHTAVADNQNILTQETATQNAAISALTNQVSDIQQVDITQVATEINLLQTQLQASYSATGTLEKMSIVNYL